MAKRFCGNGFALVKAATRFSSLHQHSPIARRSCYHAGDCARLHCTSLAAQHNFSMSQTARLLALVNLGMADAIIGCWDAKYTYSTWRPITAIQLGDTDGNDATIPDSGWTPLIVTPAFPEYPSAHSCVSGAAGRILSQAFGEETSFNVVSNAMLGVTRKFTTFSAALEEVENARVFGGIHFRTACVDGTALGIAVGDYVIAHALRATDGGH